MKLNVVIMGENVEKFLPICLNSVKDADTIIYCDGGSSDNTLSIFNENVPMSQRRYIIKNKYDQEDKRMNGLQRNFYLNYLKKNHMNEWCIALDSDEVVDEDGIENIKNMIEEYEKCNSPFNVFCIKMRHFEGNLGFEDATVAEHFVLNRLFKITDDLFYPLVEHPVLSSKKISLGKENVGLCSETTIWHLSNIPNLWEFKKKYENHLKKSNIHTPEYLKNWYWSHLFGKFPKREINLNDIPKVILDEFGIDKNEIYFANRGIEIKHPLLVREWYEYFKPKTILDLGCGRGPYLYFWKWFVPDCRGIELNEWAFRHPFTSNIINHDITKFHSDEEYDLVTCIDVLEHLDKRDLDKALEKIKGYSKNIIFSLPFEGDPNLEVDNTHKIRESKQWWVGKIKKYFDILPTPDYFNFKEQIIIGKKKDG